MFLSRIVPLNLSALGGVAAGVALMLSAGTAAAQPPGKYLRIAPDARGYQVSEAVRQYHQVRTARPARGAAVPDTRTAPARRPAPGGSVVVVVSQPAPPASPSPVMVDIRGPDGEVRSFPLEGGRQAIRKREIVVRPGEEVTISIVASARR